MAYKALVVSTTAYKSPCELSVSPINPTVVLDYEQYEKDKVIDVYSTLLSNGVKMKTSDEDECPIT